MVKQRKLKSSPWELLFLAGASVLVLVLITSWSPTVEGAALLFVEEPQIVSQDLLNGYCTDPDGVERSDLAEWASSSGACDKIVCHVEPSGNYTVTHDCRPRELTENPDSVNCAWLTNSTAVYPDCCPYLSCSQSSTLTTIDPSSCYDLASAFACSVWSNLTLGCSDTSVGDVYNYTQVFCRSTCGIC